MKKNKTKIIFFVFKRGVLLPKRKGKTQKYEDKDILEQIKVTVSILLVFIENHLENTDWLLVIWLFSFSSKKK